MNDSIYILRDYGKVEIMLKNILDKKGISRNKLCNMIGTNYDLINRYYNNKVTRIDLDILARMAFVLQCDISDLLKYNKSK